VSHNVFLSVRHAFLGQRFYLVLRRGLVLFTSTGFFDYGRRKILFFIWLFFLMQPRTRRSICKIVSTAMCLNYYFFPFFNHVNKFFSSIPTQRSTILSFFCVYIYDKQTYGWKTPMVYYLAGHIAKIIFGRAGNACIIFFRMFISNVRIFLLFILKIAKEHQFQGLSCTQRLLRCVIMSFCPFIPTKNS